MQESFSLWQMQEHVLLSKRGKAGFVQLAWFFLHEHLHVVSSKSGYFTSVHLDNAANV
jgi:hypothetical protein